MMIEWFLFKWFWSGCQLVALFISSVCWLFLHFFCCLSLSFICNVHRKKLLDFFSRVGKCVFSVVGLMCVCVFCILSPMIRPWDACHAHRWYLLFRLKMIELTKAMALPIEILLASISILWMRKNCQTSQHLLSSYERMP